MDFSKKTMLLQLSIGQWTTKRKDVNATAAVRREFSTDSDSGIFQKALVSPKYTKPITEAVSELRGWHDANTLPWLYAGWRIIPTRHHSAYMQGYRTRAAFFHKRVSDFLREYDSAKYQATTSLGGLFDPADYPPVDELRGRYYVELTPQPFPATADWRADLAENEMSIIRAKAEKTVRGGLQAAQGEAINRLFEALATLASKLKMQPGRKGADGKAERNADGETAIFRDGRLDSFRDLLETLPGLNLFDDPNFAALIAETDARLGDLEPETLRADPVARAMAAGAADDILAKMAGFTGGGPLSLKSQSVGG